MQTSECAELKAAVFRMMEMMTDIKKEIKDVKKEVQKTNQLNTSQKNKTLEQATTQPLKYKFKNNKRRLNYKSYSNVKNKARRSHPNNDSKVDESPSSPSSALGEDISRGSVKKIIFLYKNTNISVNILCNNDEKIINLIQKNTNCPMISIPKLNPDSTVAPKIKRKTQKAKRRGAKQTTTDIKSENNDNNNASSILTPKNSTSTDTGYISPANASSQTYNIHDINSNDDTDNEENPKRAMPTWAQEPHLNNLYGLQDKTVTKQYEDMVFKTARQDTKITTKKLQVLGNKSFN